GAAVEALGRAQAGPVRDGRQGSRPDARTAERGQAAAERDSRGAAAEAEREDAHLRQGSSERALRRGLGCVQAWSRAAARGVKAGRGLPSVSALGLPLQ